MPPTINNAFYDELGDRWWQDDSHAIAILRIEGKLKLRYVLDGIRASLGKDSQRVLDVACGAGFLTLPLAQSGHKVKGVDFSPNSIEVAKRQGNGIPNLSFAVGDATQLDEPPSSYDAVLLMDCLEHFEQPAKSVAEASRVLRPGGKLFVHTFNRTWLSHLLAVKAIEWLSKDAPQHIHVYKMFITPEELREMARANQLKEESITGIQPDFSRGGFWRTVLTRRLQPGFEFRYCRSLAVGYMATFIKT